MIIRQTTTIFFNPVAEHKEQTDFEENNKDYRLIAESTTATVYEKTEYFSVAKRNEVEE